MPGIVAPLRPKPRAPRMINGVNMFAKILDLALVKIFISLSHRM
jgi:hypothetical protein